MNIFQLFSIIGIQVISTVFMGIEALTIREKKNLFGYTHMTPQEVMNELFFFILSLIYQVLCVFNLTRREPTIYEFFNEILVQMIN